MASFVNVKFNVPKKATNINCDIVKNGGNQKIDYNQTTNSVEWTIKKMPGDQEYESLIKITLPSATSLQAQK